MKNVFIALALLVGGQTAFAREANLVTCQSDDGAIELGYTTTSYTGKATFSLKIDGERVLPVNPELASASIQVGDTAFGKVVSVLVNRKMIADAPALVYGFVLPYINLGDAHEVTFDSLYLQGITGGYRALPTAFQRISKTAELSCSAKAVLF